MTQESETSGPIFINPGDFKFSASQEKNKPKGRCLVLAGIIALIGIAVCALTWTPAGGGNRRTVEYALGRDVPAEDQALVDSHVWWDFVLVAGYTSIFVGILFIAHRLAFTSGYRRATRIGIGMAVLAGLADVAEDLTLLLDPPEVNGVWIPAFFATLKFCALVPAVILSVWSVGTIVKAIWNLWPWRKRTDPWPVEWSDLQRASRWDRNYAVPTSQKGKTTAVCLSGGGIRSASVALGAMQSLLAEPSDGGSDAQPAKRFNPNLIVSVSGGGYTSGAFLQALHRPKHGAKAPNEWSDDAAAAFKEDLTYPELDLQNAFTEDSVEYGHIRKHSSYIASSAREMMFALLVVAKNMLLSLALVFIPAALAGVLAGAYYSRFPIAAIIPLPDRHIQLLDEAERLDLPLSQTTANAAPSWSLLGVLVVLATVLLVVANLFEAKSLGRKDERRRRWLIAAAKAVAGLAGLVAIMVLVLPGLIRAADAVSDESFSRVVGGASAVALLNYVVVLATILWRNKHSIRSAFAKLRPGASGKRSATTYGAIPILLVVVTLIALSAAWVITLGGFAAWTYRGVLGDVTREGVIVDQYGGMIFWVGLGAALAWAVLAANDVTASSLHPFYRSRLARAFAVRRVEESPVPSAGAVTTAQRYPEREPTEFAYFAEDEHFANPDRPQFIFAAAASVGGDDSPAPGLGTVSYTFSTDWIGGPDIGWIRSSALRDPRVSARIRRDLTVQAAVATSGAAFASAMGRMAKGYETLLAVSGARLGTWLPNPAFLAQSFDEVENLAWPHGLPKFRGAGYFYRELFGSHSVRGRLLQVTDGGHYENLGLVEALRRRCTTIVCVDASGDTPPSLSTLSDAIRLAEYDLGIEFDIDTKVLDFNGRDLTAAALEPGTGTIFGDDTDFAELNARITKGCVVKIDFRYPEDGGTRESGTIIFAKAVLWERCPHWLLTYANTHPAFPHDSTSDQWFNEGQFAAYTELGRQIGSKARAVWAPLDSMGDDNSGNPVTNHRPSIPGRPLGS